MIYCSAGLNRIIILTNGNIYPCYSLGSIGNIYNFDINKLKITKCNKKKCPIRCDEISTKRS